MRQRDLPHPPFDELFLGMYVAAIEKPGRHIPSFRALPGTVASGAQHIWRISFIFIHPAGLNTFIPDHPRPLRLLQSVRPPHSSFRRDLILQRKGLDRKDQIAVCPIMTSSGLMRFGSVL